MQINAWRWSTIIWIIIIALIILPAIISLLFIKEYGVNVCYWDAWDVVPLFDKLYTGQLSFGDLFAQHSDHRIFFPQLIMLSLGNLTHYNNLAEMYFSWLLIFITGILLFKFYIRHFGNTQGAIARFIPVTWLIFSLRQWENLLWGFQLAWFMVVLFMVLALYLLAASSRPGWRLGLSVISGVVCSFSTAPGLLVWPIGLIQILLAWWTQGKESKWSYLKMLSIWFVAGILVYIVYFNGYTRPSQHNELSYFLGDPLSAIVYILVATGSPLAFDVSSGIGMAILVPALYIFTAVCLITNRNLMTLPYMPFFISLILFALFTVAILMVSRLGFGAQQAFASRYTSMTILGIIGLYLTITSLELNNKIKLFTHGFIIALIVFGIFTTYAQAIIVDGKTTRDARNLAAHYLANIGTQDTENLKQLNPSPHVVQVRANILKKYHLNVFSPDFISLYAIIDEKQLTKLPGFIWTPTGGWSPGGTYIKEKPYVGAYTYGSWSGSDGNTGILKSSPINVDRPAYLIMYVMTGPRANAAISSGDLRSFDSLVKYLLTGPSPTGQAIGLDTDSDGKLNILYTGNAEQRWDQWVVDLTPYINKKVSIVAIDDGKELGEWAGISEPFIMLKRE